MNDGLLLLRPHRPQAIEHGPARGFGCSVVSCIFFLAVCLRVVQKTKYIERERENSSVLSYFQQRRQVVGVSFRVPKRYQIDVVAALLAFSRVNLLLLQYYIQHTVWYQKDSSRVHAKYA